VTDPEAVADADVATVDPFDLPEWLGDREVVWTAASALTGRQRVAGELSGRPAQDLVPAPDGDDATLACDLLAVDQAWPRPVLGERWRRAAHGEWSRGEVLLVRMAGRLTLAVPGTALAPDVALDAIGRLARSVGVTPSRFLVALRP
jgi:hypothetical protein